MTELGIYHPTFQFNQNHNSNVVSNNFLQKQDVKPLLALPSNMVLFVYYSGISIHISMVLGQMLHQAEQLYSL